MNTQKRKRVLIACDSCRKIRRKCDGLKPDCSACQQKQKACKYSFEIDQRKPISREHVAALNRKIEILESKVAAYEAGCTGSRDSDGLRNSVTPTVIDHIDPFTKLNKSDDGILRFYGPRSCISFISEKLNIMNPERVLERRMETMNAVVLLNKQFVISEELRDHLLDLFWTFQNSSLYLVCQNLFLADMNAGRSSRFYSLSLLSAILAVGSRFSDRPEVRTDPSDPGSAGVKYAEVAKLLLSYEREYPSVTTIQASAVLAIFYLYMDMDAAAWEASGSSIRMAFSLGINILDEAWAEDGDISDDEDQVRRVVWWGCYLLDHIMSNVLGRPVAIKRHNITCLVPSEDCIDDYSKWTHPLHSDHVLNGSQSRLLSTTVCMIELYMISSEPLNQIYLSFHPCPKSEIEAIVNNANLELIEFERSLPSFMRLVRAKKEPLLPHVYIFHLRYHHIQLLLHRGLCLRDEQPPQDLEKEGVHQRICRVNANAVSKLIQEYRSNYGLLCLDFATPDCFCTAAIVHIFLSQSPDPQLKMTAVKNFNICIEALKETTASNLFSRRNMAVLRVLAEKAGLQWPTWDN